MSFLLVISESFGNQRNLKGKLTRLNHGLAPRMKILSIVTALIEMKLEKHKNLKEESQFYWQEIQNGTLQFNRRDAEVTALKQLKKEEFIDFFDEYITVGAPRKRSLSIRVYGSQHLNEIESDKDQVPSQSVQIQDIVNFRKSLMERSQHKQ